MSNIKNLVENPHPIYAKYNSYWHFLLESYEGGVDYAQSLISDSSSGRLNQIINIMVNGKPLVNKSRSNLFKHKKERDEDFIERVEMSYYYNFCDPIIDIYTNHLFKDSINEDWGSIESSVLERKDNIDRKGSNLSEFRRETSELAQIFGHVYIITDMPSADGEIISLAQQQEQGLFPYLTHFHPTDVLNWALDQNGQPYWVLVREAVDGNIDPFNFDPKLSGMLNYRVWTRDEWVLFNGGFEEIARSPHPAGKVPIDIVYNKQSKKYKNFKGISAIEDVAFIARDVYNKCSELNEIIRNQTFAILCLQGTSTEYDDVSVGTGKGLLYPPDRNVPQYVSPPAENAKTLMEHIEMQVHKMYQLSKLEGGSAQQETQVDSQSGVSKAFDFQETNSALAKKAGHMEDGEMRIWDTFARWLGQEFDGSISYPRDFNIQELNDDIDESEALMRMKISNDFNIELKKQLVKKKFPRMDDDKMKAIVDEIESTEGVGEGQSIRDRLPNLFNNGNAGQGGINRENNNGRRPNSARGE